MCIFARYDAETSFDLRVSLKRGPSTDGETERTRRPGEGPPTTKSRLKV